LFETEVLILLREKEIGVPWDSSLARVRQLAPLIPPEFEAARVTALAEAVHPDVLGLSGAEVDTVRSRSAAFAPHRQGELDWISGARYSSAFREYLALSIDCSTVSADPTVLPAQRVYAGGQVPPIIEYRRSTCEPYVDLGLQRVRAAVPRFAETDYFRAQLNLDDVERTGGARAHEFLQNFHTAFRESASATYLLGALARATDECERALPYFAATLTLRPAHEHALLGEAICLTGVKRHADAITSATQIIDDGVRNVVAALYWRALNHRALGNLPLARADIERAKRFGIADDVYTISGLIAFEMDDVQLAEADLLIALSMPSADRNCTGAFFLGRVYVSFGRDMDAAARFEQSMLCCEAAVNSIRALIDETQSDDEIEAGYKLRRLRRMEQQVLDNRAQQYAAAFNAANHFFRSGNVARARELLQVAALDSTLAEPVAKLRGAIGGGL
jgi:tetratricopeptide (TPR) repeat protein